MIVQELPTGFPVNERRVYAVVGMDHSSYRYRSTAHDQTALQMRLRDRAVARVRYGYRRLHVLVRSEGWLVNHKRVYRLYRTEGLALRHGCRRKRANAVSVFLSSAERPNERRSMSFVSDILATGQRFRALTIVATVSRVSPAIEVDSSLTGQLVVAVLERLKRTYGIPA